MRCPSASHQPASTSQIKLPIRPSGAGADIGLARDFVAPHRPGAERQQGIDRDIERGPRPGQADDGDGHDDGGDHPAERHPRAAEQNPEDVQKDGNRLHAISSKLEGCDVRQNL